MTQTHSMHTYENSRAYITFSVSGFVCVCVFDDFCMSPSPSSSSWTGMNRIFSLSCLFFTSSSLSFLISLTANTVSIRSSSLFVTLLLCVTISNISKFKLMARRWGKSNSNGNELQRWCYTHEYTLLRLLHVWVGYRKRMCLCLFVCFFSEHLSTFVCSFI